MIIIKHTIDFIKKMRRLIREGSFEFLPRSYDGKDYVTVLLEDFMITPDDAIKEISYLNQHFWVTDGMPEYHSTGAFVFKKKINDTMAYIKLNIDEDEEGEILLVISFHKDY